MALPLICSLNLGKEQILGASIFQNFYRTRIICHFTLPYDGSENPFKWLFSNYIATTADKGELPFMFYLLFTFIKILKFHLLLLQMQYSSENSFFTFGTNFRASSERKFVV